MILIKLSDHDRTHKFINQIHILTPWTTDHDDVFVVRNGPTAVTDERNLVSFLKRETAVGLDDHWFKNLYHSFVSHCMRYAHVSLGQELDG